ncbi:MAG: hypothetical protein EOP84_01720 [Verrucomicrobiaceae bacterium]|nr:MAG: hypothetical protein EOP84_01720 [Verrucomicrobiaceae bacterium]
MSDCRLTVEHVVNPSAHPGTRNVDVAEMVYPTHLSNLKTEYKHNLYVRLVGRHPVETQRAFLMFVRGWVHTHWKASFYLNGHLGYRIADHFGKLLIMTNNDDHVFEAKMALEGYDFGREME